jgi:hypothetical protein
MPVPRYHYKKKSYYGHDHAHPVEKDLADAHETIAERKTLTPEDIKAYDTLGVKIAEQK